METGQKAGQFKSEDTGLVHNSEQNAIIYNEFLTFCATSGLSMDEDGSISQMTTTQFAAVAGISRSVLYYWKAQPNFWREVDSRAREVFNRSTKFAIMKGLRLKAMAGDTKAAEFVLSHYSDYTPPAQKHEVKISGWADMVREARKKKIKAQARANSTEGEVVDQPGLPNNTSVPSPKVSNSIPLNQPVIT